MTKATLSVPNISCGHCVSAIETELAEMEGVATVEADAETKTVTVQWDAPTTMERIRAALNEINYPARP
jgi:copper chaperone